MTPEEIRRLYLETACDALRDLWKIEDEEYRSCFTWERLERTIWRKLPLSNQYQTCLPHIHADPKIAARIVYLTALGVIPLNA